MKPFPPKTVVSFSGVLLSLLFSAQAWARILPVEPPKDEQGMLIVEGQGAGAGVSDEAALLQILADRMSRCWRVDPNSKASQISVTLTFSLDEGGRLSGGPTMIANSGGEAAAVRAAYDTARRAVVRCSAEHGGLDISAERYNGRRNIEMTFDPRVGQIK